MFENLTFAPPEIGIPPRTRPMRICVSSWFPPVEVTDRTLIALMNAAKPVMTPARTYTRNLVFVTLIPAKRAPLSLAPMAFRLAPKEV